jgi:hypothetical protein
MKTPREFTINYIVHATSILDLDLLTQILRPLADSVAEKVEVEQYIHDFERVFKEKAPTDSHFVVTHGLCKVPNCDKYNYTFTADSSRVHFTIKFQETKTGMIFIEECDSLFKENQINFSSFKGKYIEAPF